VRYTKLSIIIKTDVKPPYFIGSQWRGAFGHALKKVTCINPSMQCEGCFATSNCLYYEFYEEKNSFHGFRLGFELGKGYYDVDIFLFEQATQKLPYVISALHQMITGIGLGKDQVTHKEYMLYLNDKQINHDGKIVLPQNIEQEFLVETTTSCSHPLVTFITPLRMKKNNRFIRDGNIELADIINSIYQRAHRLKEEPMQKLPFEPQGKIVKRDIHYQELTRKSNRQKKIMNLGGIMGIIEIENIDENSYQLLKLGELIGVGKQTVFGLGNIKVEEV
jgi:hypothetical protein